MTLEGVSENPDWQRLPDAIRSLLCSESDESCGRDTDRWMAAATSSWPPWPLPKPARWRAPLEQRIEPLLHAPCAELR